MTRRDDPKPPPGPAKLVLPRPNLGPEPWSEPRPSLGPIELILGSTLAILASAILIRTWRRWRARRLAATRPADPSGSSLEAEPTPSRRLIASSQAVRAALIAEFGAAWGSRTTEEIADDPTLADRLGPEQARAVVAYLRRVDRAKFAGEEFDNVDESIATARAFLSRPGRVKVSEPPGAGRRPRRSS